MGRPRTLRSLRGGVEHTFEIKSHIVSLRSEDTTSVPVLQYAKPQQYNGSRRKSQSLMSETITKSEKRRLVSTKKIVDQL